MKGYRFQKVYFVHCEQCNENIVERADELMVTTLIEAREYARTHEKIEHQGEADAMRTERAVEYEGTWWRGLDGEPVEGPFGYDDERDYAEEAYNRNLLRDGDDTTACRIANSGHKGEQ